MKNLNEYADIHLKINKKLTKYKPVIVHTKYDFLFYYRYVPNDWKKNSVEYLINPPQYGISIEKIRKISIKKSENNETLLQIFLKNIDLINFKKFKLTLNPLLNEKMSKKYIKKTSREFQEEINISKDIVWTFKNIKTENFSEFLTILTKIYEHLKLKIPLEMDVIVSDLSANESRFKGVTFDEKTMQMNLAIIVKKLNNSKLTYNKRILHLTSSSIVYYNKIPHNWKGTIDNQFKLLKFAPKAGIILTDIISITDINENNKIGFKISFPKEKLLEFSMMKNFTKDRNPVRMVPFRPDLYYTKKKIHQAIKEWKFYEYENGDKKSYVIKNFIEKIHLNINNIKKENTTYEIKNNNKEIVEEQKIIENTPEIKNELIMNSPPVITPSEIIEESKIISSKTDKTDKTDKIEIDYDPNYKSAEGSPIVRFSEVKKTGSESSNIGFIKNKINLSENEDNIDKNNDKSLLICPVPKNKTKRSIFYSKLSAEKFETGISKEDETNLMKKSSLAPNESENFEKLTSPKKNISYLDTFKKMELSKNNLHSKNNIDYLSSNETGERNRQKSILKKNLKYSSKDPYSQIFQNEDKEITDTENEMSEISIRNLGGINDKQKSVLEAEVFLKKIGIESDDNSISTRHRSPGKFSRSYKCSLPNIKLETINAIENPHLPSIVDWEFKFQQLIQEILNSYSNYDLNLKINMFLMHFLGEFNIFCKELIKDLIDDLPYNKKFKIEKFKTTDNFFTYFDEKTNISVKFSWTEQKKFDNGDVNYDKSNINFLNQEHIALDLLNDLFLDLRREKRIIQLTVPISCLISYKGCKALIIANPPFIDKNSLIYGPFTEENYRTSSLLDKSLKIIGRNLNIKPHKYIWNPSINPFPIYLSVFCEIYQSIETDDFEFQSSNDFDSNPNLKKMDSSISSTPENPIEKDSNQKILHYLIKAGELIPPDIDLSQNQHFDPSRKLRPEYSLKTKKALNPDVFLNFKEKNIEANEDNQLALDASNHLREFEIQKLLDELERLEIIPINGNEMIEIMHNKGINLRYLGIIAKNTNLPHIKQICQAEMLARRLKNIYRYYISEYLKKESKKKTLTFSNEILQDSDLIEFIIDFLNLIFGKDKESSIFWEKILIPNVFLYYRYTIIKIEIINGLLFNSILQNLNININVEEILDLQSILKEKKFEKKHFAGFKSKCHQYKFMVLEINNIVSHLNNKKFCNFSNEDLDLYEKYLKIKENIENCLKSDDSEKLFQIKIKLIEVLLIKSQKDQALMEMEDTLLLLSPWNPLLLKLYIELIKLSLLDSNLEKAKNFFKKVHKLIEINFNGFHPLMSTFYNFFGIYFDEKSENVKSLKYYQKSLDNCLHTLGVNHIYTVDAYANSAKIYIKLNQRTEAFDYLLKGFNILEAVEKKPSELVAKAAYQMSSFLLAIGRPKEAVLYANISEEYFEKYSFKDDLNLINIYLIISQAAENYFDQYHCFSYLNKTWLLLERNHKENFDFYFKTITIAMSIILKALNNKEKFNFYKNLVNFLDEFENKLKIKFINPNDDINGRIEIIENIKFKIREYNSFSEYILHLINELQIQRLTLDKNNDKQKNENFKQFKNVFSSLIILLGAKFFIEKIK